MLRVTQSHTNTGKYVTGIPDNYKYNLKIAQDVVDCPNDPQDQLHESYIFFPNKCAENS